MIEDCNAKVGSQEVLGVQSSLVMEYRMKQGKNKPHDSTNGRHQMVNMEIRLITFFAAKNGETLYRHQKQAR